MFEKAARMKLRFESSKGLLTVEDLWDLPLNSARGASLQAVGQVLVNELQTANANTFKIDENGGSEATKANAEAELKLEIVKHIAAIRVAENSEAAKARENKEKKQKLLALIDEKKNEALSKSSVEELEAMVAAL